MKVLLALEAHRDATRVLDRALDHVVHGDDEVTVAVVPRGEGREPAELRDAVREALERRGVSAEIRILSGEPAGALVEMAEDGGFDELVLGGGRRSPTGKMRLGRAAEFAVLNARTTVVLVR